MDENEDMTADEFRRRFAAGTPVELDVQLARPRLFTFTVTKGTFGRIVKDRAMTYTQQTRPGLVHTK